MAIIVSSGKVSSGVIVSYDSMYVYDGGTANSTTVNSSGYMYVDNGGVANSTTVNSSGYMYVTSGGTANSTSVNGDYSNDIYGYLCVDGGEANETTVNSGGRLYISSGGVANGTVVNSKARAYVASDGVANDTAVNRKGSMFVCSGGVATNTILRGGMTVSSGGVASETFVEGYLYVESGGKVAGTLAMGENASVEVDAGGVIDFDILTVAPGAAARVNNLSLIQGAPDYTVTVSATQAAGTYTLAEGAAGFNKTITVNTDTGTMLGTINVGGELKYGDYTYSLAKIADTLSLTVVAPDSLPPEPPTAAASTTAPTNHNVTVTATYSSDSNVKQYSLDNSTWQNYTTGVVMSANGTVYFRGIDAAGNISEVTSYTVGNIDKVAPNKPTANANITAPTNRDVVVTATFSSDSISKQYSLDGSTWNDYASGVVMSANGTVYFRGIDAAGNISEVTSYEVANIERSPLDFVGNIGFTDYEDRFQPELDCSGWYTIAGDFGKLNGSVSIMQGTKSVATGTIKNGVLKFNNNKDVLLDSANDYTVVVKNSDKGKSASEYTFTLEAKTLFTKGDNSDDWTDVKTAGAAGAVDLVTIGVVDGSASDLLADWVGYGDTIDYKAFTLDSAAKLSFTVSASDAAKFTIYALNDKTDKKGVTTYTLASKQATALTKPKGAVEYSATTKELLLDKGTYYIAVQSANAAKGGDADYSVVLNDKSVFYTKGDNSDDWTDVKTAGAAGAVGNVGVIDAVGTVIGSEWVGYGDAVDYKAFTLDSAAKLSFDVSASDAAKFTIYALNGKTDKKGVTTYTLASKQATALTKPKGAVEYSATTKELLLDKGTYYIAVQAANATKGGDADYSVVLNDKSVFFVDGDDGWNNYLYDAKTKTLNPFVGDFPSTAIDKYTGEVVFDSAAPDLDGWRNFVGYGDDADFATITLAEAASLSFDLEAADAAKFTVNRLVKNANGTCTVKVLQTTTLAKAKGAENCSAATKSLKLDAGEYFISMQSTNAAKGGAAYYNVSVNQTRTDFYENLFVDYDAKVTSEQLAGGTDVVLSWAASPADARRKVTYFVSIDGGKETKVTGTTYTFKKLAMTDHVAHVYAKDEYGNVSETFDCAFHIADTVAPKVSGLSVTTKYNTATVKFKGTDNVAVAGYHVTIDGKETYLAADEYNAAGLTFDGLAYGVHSVTVRAEDTSGNLSATLTKNFTLKPPSGTVALDTASAIVVDKDGYWGGGSYVESGESRIYRFDTTVPGLLKLYMDDWSDSRANSTVTVYREVGDGLGVKVGSTQFNSASSKPSLKLHLDPAGTYYLSCSAGNGTEVSLDWYICTADLDNNSFETAEDLHDGKDNYLCAADPADYYKFTVDEAGVYEYGAGYVSYGSVAQTLYDADRQKIASKNITHDKDVRYLAAGDYYLKCEYNGKATDYTLSGLWLA